MIPIITLEVLAVAFFFLVLANVYCLEMIHRVLKQSSGKLFHKLSNEPFLPTFFRIINGKIDLKNDKLQRFVGVYRYIFYVTVIVFVGIMVTIVSYI